MDRSLLRVLLIIAVTAYGSHGVHGKSSKTKGCKNNPADIVFVLDESRSIYPPDFQVQLGFVASVVEDFQVAKPFVHVGVMTFGEVNKVHFDLSYKNKPFIIKTINNITFGAGGSTQTGDALERMRVEMFSQQFSDRPGVPQIAIVITDGESTDQEATTVQAALAHQDGIKVFAIGVGLYIDMQELQRIASQPSYVFNVASFDALETLRDILAWEACAITTPAPPTTTVPTTTLPQWVPDCSPADVLFAVPDEAGIKDTSLALDWIVSVLPEAEEIGPHGVRVGLTPRICGDRAPISLDQYDTHSELAMGIKNRNLQSSRISLQVEQMLFGYDEAEPRSNEWNAKKIGILVVDNRAENEAELLEMALQAKEMQVRLVVVGVGEKVDPNQLAKLVTSEEDLHFVDTYEQLYELTHTIAGKVCNKH